MGWFTRGVLVGSLLLTSLGPGVPGMGATPPSSGTASPDVRLQQVHMIETRDGSKLWEVRADRAEIHEREGYTILSRVTRPVQVALYSPQGRLTCTANRVTVDLRTKDVKLEGSVFARSEQGTELKTEELRWLAATRRLTTDQPVTLARGAWLSRGRGLEAETDLERVRIFQNITSQVRSPLAVPKGPGRSVNP